MAALNGKSSTYAPSIGSMTKTASFTTREWTQTEIERHAGSDSASGAATGQGVTDEELLAASLTPQTIVSLIVGQIRICMGVLKFHGCQLLSYDDQQLVVTAIFDSIWECRLRLWV